MYTWISPNNPTPHQGIYTDTFFCQATNNILFLSEGVHPHQFVLSLYEILKHSPDESMLLTEFFTETRDHYFNNFLTNAKNGYHSNTTFYSKNTLRYPVLVKVDSTSIKSKDTAAILPGLFVVIRSNSPLDRWADMRELLIGNIKELFASLSYTVGRDVILTDEYNYSQKLSMNKDPVKQYRCVFILLISTGSTAQNISFEDGTEINVDTLMNKIATKLPNIPKVIFSSHLVEGLPRVKVREYEHMFVVHSIETSLSENSLIYNFSMEIQANYFAELHSILRSSIVHSTQSSWIQIVDGFRRNFYINYQGHLAQLLNKESSEFRKSYEEACQTGTEPFKFYRLMIVGPENTGKTSLLRVLTGQTFQKEEKTTGFVDKYTVEVQKMSNEWSKNEDLSTYMNNIKETHQDLAMKVVAKWMSRPPELANTPKNEPTSIVTPQTQSIVKPQIQSSVTSPLQTEPTPNSEVPGLKETAISNTTPPEPVEKFDSTPHEKIESTLNRIQSLGSKSDFFTAWDFAGQNYLYCFHSLFLSPRSVYLLLVDLTIEDLNSKIEERHREDRNENRSKTGVPETYLQVYEFWLNAIYSVSKTGQTSGHYTTTKIIFVFSKADEVKEDAKQKAKRFLNTIREHMYPKNNSFSLVHEDEMFILSCKSDSPYFQNISKLKSTIKQLSDKVAFQEPIPIKWLNLANDILRDDQPIIDKSYVQLLANNYKCSDELDDFLHFFNDIGFLFYKQNKIIIDIQKLLNLIHCILFPQFVKNEKRKLTYTIQDVTKLNENGQLSYSLFENILAILELTHFKEHLLSLLLSYGILIRNEEFGENSQYFYVPYLTIGSLDDLKQRIQDKIFKKLKVNSTFLIFFADGFLPASLYFTLISKCLQKNKDEKLPPSHLGFDCAIFYVSKNLLVSLEFSKDRTNIIVSFFTYDSQTFEEDECNSEIINYLKFLQLSIVEIQTLLILCGNLAKLMFVCDTCDTLSLLEKGERPTCSLDIVFSINVAEILSELKVAKPQSNPSISTVGKGFCCNNQLIKASNYMKSTDLYSELKHQSYDIATLEDFILKNQDHFTENLNWWKLSYPLYSNGLITIQRFSSIIYFGKRIEEKSNDLFRDLFHKGPLWAVKLYVALCCNRENVKNQNLVKFIRDKCDRPFENVKEGKQTSHCDPETSIRTVNPTMYRMNINRHGIAFIVNIEKFEDGGMYPERKGSNHDLISLITLFKVLQYDSKVYENVTRLQFVRAIKSIQSVDHSMYDSFFCVIMSHGNEKEEVIFSNKKTLPKFKIVNQFSPRYCKGLESKPRIFIFQACRGSERKSDNGKVRNEFGRAPVREITSYKFPAKIDETVDTFIGDSTLDQYVSYRSESDGTFYIQSL